MSGENDLNRLLTLAGVSGQEATRLDEASISRIMRHVHSGVPFATLTAFRGDLTPAENRARNRDLASRIAAMNLGFIPITGHYEEKVVDGPDRPVVEDSLFVIGNPGMAEEDFQAAIANLGADFDQDTVLLGFKDGTVALRHTTGKFAYNAGNDILLGDFTPARLGKMFSEWKGRPYSFREIQEGRAVVESSLINVLTHWGIEITRNKQSRRRI